MKLGLVLLLAIQASMSVMQTYVSSWNYPGALAMWEIASYPKPQLSVHLDPETAMTGACRFLEQPWIRYNKSETLKWPKDYQHFDVVISAEERKGEGWTVWRQIRGYGGFQRSREWRVEKREDALQLGPVVMRLPVLLTLHHQTMDRQQ